MVPRMCGRVAIASIVLSLAVPAHAQSPGSPQRQPGPIAASAARIVLEQSSKIQRSPRSRVRRKSCAETMLIGTGIGTGIGLVLGVPLTGLEQGTAVMLATTAFFAMVGFVVGYRMCD
jgi:hypothetical protein